MLSKNHKKQDSALENKNPIYRLPLPTKEKTIYRLPSPIPNPRYHDNNHLKKIHKTIMVPTHLKSYHVIKPLPKLLYTRPTVKNHWNQSQISHHELRYNTATRFDENAAPRLNRR